MLDEPFIQLIADEVDAGAAHVKAALELLHSGARPPFIAHYRQDITGQLSENALNTVGLRLVQYVAVSQRRNALLDLLDGKGWLTPELREEISACTDADALDDLYLPYKKHRGSQADIARERGLGFLAELIWEQDESESDVEGRAAEFVDPARGVDDAAMALDGAAAILKERIAFDRKIRQKVRTAILDEGKICARQSAVAEGKRTKFKSYHDFSEPLSKIPPHRFLALMRGARQGMLAVTVETDDQALLDAMTAKYLKQSASPFEPYIKRAVEEAYQESLRPQCEEQALSQVRKAAEEHAVRVFCDNARGLYLQPPAGPIRVLALEAGLDDRCALVVVDGTGACVAHETMVLTGDGATEALAAKTDELLDAHSPEAFALSTNGLSREVAFEIRGAMRERETQPYFVHVNASGLGASAGGEEAEKEFPELSRAARAAVGLARRHQNPLAELAKVDPRSIGVGQYYQDVNQKRLIEALNETLESCIDFVGLDLNTAGAAQLSQLSGLRPEAAASIVEHRESNGAFPSREALSEVRGVGPKVYEQCVGFLFVEGGENPLDATRIHPARYGLVERIAAEAGVPVNELMGNEERLEAIDFAPYEADAGGPFSLKDLKWELGHPRRDPRRRFRAPRIHESLKSLDDIEPGQSIEGVVTNVTDFGAFVDVGVKQDGLVHLSELAHHFVHDPHQVVRVGQYVKVKVLEVDRENPRISLSLKALKPAKAKRPKRPRASGEDPKPRREPTRAEGGSKKPRPPKGKRPEGKPRPPKRQPEEKEKVQMNTQLADQLAGLREKFSREG